MISVFCLTQKCQHGYHQRGLSDRKKFVFCLTQKCHHGYHQRGLSDRKSLCFVWHKNVIMVIINVVCSTEKVCVLSDTKMSSWLSSTWFVWQKKFVFCLTQKCHHGYHQRGLSDRKSLCFVWHKNVIMVIINVVCLTENVCVLSDTKMSSWLSSTWFVRQKKFVFCLTQKCHHGYHQRGLFDRKSLCFVWHKNVIMVIINVVCLTEKVCVLSDTKMSSWLSSTWFVWQKKFVFCLTQKCHHGYHQRGLSDRKSLCFVWHKNVIMVIINVVCWTEKSACRWTFTVLSPATGCPMPSSMGRSWWPTPSSYACATAWFWCPSRTACFTGRVPNGASSTWPATWVPRRSTCVRRPDWMRWVTMQKRIKQQQKTNN